MAIGNTGSVKQVMGPVVDVEFSDGNLPDILSALVRESSQAPGGRAITSSG